MIVDRFGVPLSRTVELVRGIRGMLWVPPSFAGTRQTNLTAAARAGTYITASGSTNTKGSWASLINPTTAPSYGIWVMARAVSQNNIDTSILLDIGYGPTGGGNEEVLLPNLDCGAAQTAVVNSGKCWFFPVYIPSGVRVSARSQAAIASDTVQVAIWLGQAPLYAGPSLGGVLDYGTDLTNSRGTSVTAGNGAFGSWSQLTASTTRDHRFWAAGYDQLGDTSIANAEALLELGIGPDSGNVSTIHGPVHFSQGASENIQTFFPCTPSYAPVKAGSAIWARIASAETEARGVIAYGVD